MIVGTSMSLADDCIHRPPPRFRSSISRLSSASAVSRHHSPPEWVIHGASQITPPNPVFAGQICRQWTAGSEAVVKRYSMSLVIPSPLTVPFVDSPRRDEWLYGTPPPNNALERKFRTKNAP
ncbi:hypothetical protein CDEST_14706 [Colletotrichum destructivum]|uniref:Uncharacterized protein n=1 Tax=Colletotrichum destructivum TaxID=34406 RepID=A0AAX4J2C9_9PEZI|nr:hypothetical protein CDEST_14706 [Colletotrichum destructivum]